MSEKHFSSFERWPDALFYAPIFFYWFWLALRYRSLSLPTITNLPPALSGYLGESKGDALDLLGSTGRAHVAPYALFRATGRDDLGAARRAMESAGLAYPIVAKPDIGQNGTGVKIIKNESELARYLATFPAGLRVIVQKYIADEGEAGVFYIRYPHEEQGRVPSLTLKYFPTVTGDGKKTLRDLIRADARASQIAPLYFARHQARLDEVVPAGEVVRLISVGNHCKGALFKNGAAHITEEMRAAFDAVAKEIPGFYFGRFDVRYTSLEALKRGEGFTILEVNGADSEMTHIWDANTSLATAWGDQCYQFRTAFAIGDENRAGGATPAGALAIIGSWFKNRNLFARYPNEE